MNRRQVILWTVSATVVGWPASEPVLRDYVIRNAIIRTLDGKAIGWDASSGEWQEIEEPRYPDLPYGQISL